MSRASNIYQLGVKELWSLWRDPVMMIMIVFVFTVMIYSAATALGDTLHNAPIAVVDEDRSPLSTRIVSAFLPPYFTKAQEVSHAEADQGLDAGKFTFALNIPPEFQQDVLAGRKPAIQLNVDATRMTQGFNGSVHVQEIILTEVNEFVQRYRSTLKMPVDLALRMRFNPNIEHPWFTALMEIINQITLLSIILAGTAIMREREHGTIEHLLVMPVNASEIMLAKIWSMGLVVIVATSLSIFLIVKGALHVPIRGSIPLFLLCTALYLFATTSMGIFMATLSRSTPQFGLMVILIVLPLVVLSGNLTPSESMPVFVQNIMLAFPTSHFVSCSQGILYRSAGFDIVWPRMVILMGIGVVYFSISLTRFRKMLSQMA